MSPDKKDEDDESDKIIVGATNPGCKDKNKSPMKKNEDDERDGTMGKVTTKEATIGSKPHSPTEDGNNNVDSGGQSDKTDNENETTSSPGVVSGATMVAHNKSGSSVDIDNIHSLPKITAKPNKGGATIQRDGSKVTSGKSQKKTKLLLATAVAGSTLRRSHFSPPAPMRRPPSSTKKIGVPTKKVNISQSHTKREHNSGEIKYIASVSPAAKKLDAISSQSKN